MISSVDMRGLPSLYVSYPSAFTKLLLLSILLVFNLLIGDRFLLDGDLPGDADRSFLLLLGDLFGDTLASATPLIGEFDPSRFDLVISGSSASSWKTTYFVTRPLDNFLTVSWLEFTFSFC